MKNTKERKMIKLLRRKQKAKMSASELNENHTKNRARQALYREIKKGKSKKQYGFTFKS